MKPIYLHHLPIDGDVSDAVLMYGDQIKTIPGLPGWAKHACPFVLLIATIIHKLASSINQQQSQTNATRIASVAAQTGSTLPTVKDSSTVAAKDSGLTPPG